MGAQVCLCSLLESPKKYFSAGILDKILAVSPVCLIAMIAYTACLKAQNIWHPQRI